MSNHYLRPEELERQHVPQQERTAEWYLQCLRQRIQELPIQSVYDLQIDGVLAHMDEQTRNVISNEFFRAGWSEACFHVCTEGGTTVVQRLTLAK